jgi:hypothetical protein
MRKRPTFGDFSSFLQPATVLSRLAHRKQGELRGPARPVTRGGRGLDRRIRPPIPLFPARLSRVGRPAVGTEHRPVSSWFQLLATMNLCPCVAGCERRGRRCCARFLLRRSCCGSGGAAPLLPTRACVFGVPDRESALGGVEVGAELVVEVRDRRTLLEELILDSALGIAGVPLSLVVVERGAALVAGHVARPEHVVQRSAAACSPFSLLGSTASA